MQLFEPPISILPSPSLSIPPVLHTCSPNIYMHPASLQSKLTDRLVAQRCLRGRSRSRPKSGSGFAALTLTANRTVVPVPYRTRTSSTSQGIEAQRFDLQAATAAASVHHFCSLPGCGFHLSTVCTCPSPSTCRSRPYDVLLSLRPSSSVLLCLSFPCLS